MTKDQITTMQIVSPLQLLTLPLDILQQTQLRMMSDTIQAMGGNTGGATVSERQEPVQKLTSNPRIFQRNNYPIRKSDILLDEENGHLEELMIKSASEFSVEINVDSHQLMHKSMTELISISEDVGNIVAVFRDGVYRFNIRDIRFNSIFMRVFLAGTGSFDIYYKVVLDER